MAVNPATDGATVPASGRRRPMSARSHSGPCRCRSARPIWVDPPLAPASGQIELGSSPAFRRKPMTLPIAHRPFDRRTVLKGAAAAGVLQVASPFIIAARGETPIRIGMVDPFTGVYAAVAQNE